MIITTEEQKTLLSIARLSIEVPLKTGNRYEINPFQVTENLNTHKAVFVTLYVHNELHGCVGSIKAFRPLAEDVSHNAFSAAFEDFRFEQIQLADLDFLKIELSILSKPVKINFENETDLFDQVKEFEDGLIVKFGKKKATFLPTVWEKLPHKRQFIGRLKEKAGLPFSFWSNQLEFFKYNTKKISDHGKP